jgi:sulfur carrier protein
VTLLVARDALDGMGARWDLPRYLRAAGSAPGSRLGLERIVVPHMHLIVDGQERAVADDLTVSALLESEGLPAEHVLVEVNGQYLPASTYAERVLRAGDRVEMILPAFGG